MADTKSLKNHVILNKIIIDIPEHLNHPLKGKDIVNITQIYPLINDLETVKINFRIKETADLGLIKNIHESMATSFYKGEIHRSEFIEVNEKNVYVFEMTGYWNGNATKESWMKFFTVDKKNLYQCLIRFPANEYESSQKIRALILDSFKVN